MKYLVFSDIDGTFMNHENYSFKNLREYVQKIKKNCAVIFVSSKTFEEMKFIKDRLGIEFPFISENGACIYFPESYMSKKISNAEFFEIDNYLGFLVFKNHLETKNELKKLKKKFNFHFFSDLKDEFLSKVTNLKEKDLLRSKKRFYSDPIYWNDSKEKLNLFFKELSSSGFDASMGGRFIHVSSDCNKGTAVSKFLKLSPFNSQQKTISLGDSNNDVSMLELTDYSCIIKSPVNKKILLKKKTNIYHSRMLAPDGWKESLDHIFQKEKVYF